MVGLLQDITGNYLDSACSSALKLNLAQDVPAGRSIQSPSRMDLQRSVEWFKNGMEQGTVSACNTFQ